MIKNIFIFITVSFFITGCSTNQLVIPTEKKMEREKVSNELLGEISYILFLLKQKDLETINSQLINPRYGVYEIYKNENTNRVTFKHSLKIEEISNHIDSFDVKEELITFDCSPQNDAFYGWSKEGVFLTTDIKPYLSQMMTEINKILPNRYKEDELKRVEQIEKTSYELIVTYNNIFYLTKIDNRWYITLIDGVKTDCSQ